MFPNQLLHSARSVVLSGSAKLSVPFDLGWNPPPLDVCHEHAPHRGQMLLLRLPENLSRRQSTMSLVETWLAYAFPPPITYTTKELTSPSKTTAVEGFDPQVPAKYAWMIIALSMVLLAISGLFAGVRTLSRQSRRSLPEQPAQDSSPGIKARFSAIIFPSLLRVTFILYCLITIIAPAIPQLLCIRLLRGTHRLIKLVSSSICLLGYVFSVLLFLALYHGIATTYKTMERLTLPLCVCILWVIVSTVNGAHWFIEFIWRPRAIRSFLDSIVDLAAKIWNYEKKTDVVFCVIALARLFPTGDDLAAATSFDPIPALLAITVALAEAACHTLPYSAVFVSCAVQTSSLIHEGLEVSSIFVSPLLSHAWYKLRILWIDFLERVGDVAFESLKLLIRVLIWSFNVSFALAFATLQIVAWLLEMAALIYFAVCHVVGCHLCPPESFGPHDLLAPWSEITIPGVDCVQADFKISDLTFQGFYGAGAFGSVYKSYWSKGRAVALKVCRKMNDETAKRRRQQIMIEAMVLTVVQRKRMFPKFYGIFETSSSYSFAMKGYDGGTVLDRLRTVGPFGIEDTRIFSAQLLLGVNYLHRLGIIHHDIKPDNILLKGGKILITDFGVSFRFTECYSEDWLQRKKNDGFNWPPLHPYHGHPHILGPRGPGTPNYMAPELLRDELYSYGVDYWSCGITIYAMLENSLPNVDDHHGTVQFQWQYVQRDRHAHVAAFFLHKVLAFDPIDRPPLARMMRDPFFAPIRWDHLDRGLDRRVQ